MLFLLSSKTTVAWAHYTILAIIFTFFQDIECLDTSFTISDSIFSSCFYVGTEFHGFHILTRIIGLIDNVLSLDSNSFASKSSSSFFEKHFIDYTKDFIYFKFKWLEFQTICKKFDFSFRKFIEHLIMILEYLLHGSFPPI